MPWVLSAVVVVMVYIWLFYRLAKKEDWPSVIAMLILPISIILMLFGFA